MWEEDDEFKYNDREAFIPQTTSRDVMSADFWAMKRGEGSMARVWNQQQAYSEHATEVFNRTGEKLPSNPRDYLTPFESRKNQGQRGYDLGKARYDVNRQRIADKYPNEAGFIMRDLETKGLAIGKTYLKEAERTYALAPKDGRTTAARLIGTMAGAMADEPTLGASLVTGPYGAVRNTAIGLLKGAGKAAIANAIVDAMTLPEIVKYREEMGLPMHSKEIWTRAAMTIGGGAFLDFFVRGGFRAGQKLAGRDAILDPKTQGVVGYEKKGHFQVFAEPKNVEEFVEQAVVASKEGSTLSKMGKGDVDATEKVLTDLGGGKLDDPIKQQLELARQAKKLDQDEGLTPEQIAHREQSELWAGTPHDEPLPRPVEEVPKARGPHLVDRPANPESPVIPAKSVPGEQYEADGKKYYAEDFSKSQHEVQYKAEVFQFKRDGDANGVTPRLHGVEKWEAVDAGRIIVFEDLDGVRYIADGHQRLALWRRLVDKGQSPEGLHGWVFRANDGWKAGDVRAMAAKKNLKEGSGDAIDAAKVIRERPDIMDTSMPMSSNLMRQARSLARLGDEAFAKAVDGSIPPHFAALVGEFVPDDQAAKQTAIIDQLIMNPPANIAQARSMVNDMVRMPATIETQMDIFGARPVASLPLLKRAEILEHAITALRGKGKLFSTLTREAVGIEGAGNKLNKAANLSAKERATQTEELIQRLASQEGRVSDLLSEQAHALAGGKSRAAAVADFTKEVEDIFEADGIAGLMAKKDHRAHAMVDDVDAEAKALIEQGHDDMFGDAGGGYTYKEISERIEAKPEAKAKAPAKKGAKTEPVESPEAAIQRGNREVITKLKAEGLDTEALEEAQRIRQMAEVIKGCKL